MSDGPPAERPRSNLELMQRSAAVATLVNRGMTHREIAEKLSITRGQVLSSVRFVEREYREQIADAMESRKARMLNKNAEIQRELWDALARAREGKITQTVRGKGDSEVTEVTRTTVPEAEAKILAALMKAQEQESIILGVVDQKKEQAATTNQTINDNRTLIVVNDAQLEADTPWINSLPRGVGVQGKGLMPLKRQIEAAAVEAEEVKQ